MIERVPLLSSMRRDFRERGSLSRATASAMWLTYGVHAGATAWTLTRPRKQAATSRAVAVGGWGAVGAGSALCVAGMSRFANPAEVEGTRHEALTVGGVYRFSRNPQYLGYVMALSGAAIARRSRAALALAGVAAGMYAVWIPEEERQLGRRYGQAYIDYTRGVARWWGRRS